MQAHNSNAQGSAPAGEYLRFRLGKEVYAIGILFVQEIRTVEPVTKMVGADANMLGVINLRGQIVPVCDLKSKLGMGYWERTVESTYIVLSLPQKALAIVVDAVMDVCQINADQIKPASSVTQEHHTVQSIATVEEGMLMILDPHHI